MEKFSVIKTMQAIEDANVVVLVVDARDQITEQDAHTLHGYAVASCMDKYNALRCFPSRNTAPTRPSFPAMQ